MNVNTMRNIDKWVGVPLCFLFSMINQLFNLFTSGTKHPNSSRTLFIELSEMGSAIIVDPAMRKLRREGNAELFFAIFKNNYKSLEILQTVKPENIFKMRSENLFYMAVDILKFMRWCRQKRITCVIDLELFSRFTALLCFLSGAKFRAGFSSFHDEGLYRGNMINLPVRYNPHVHVAVNFVSLVNRVLGLFKNPYATVPLKKGDLDLAQASISPDQMNIIKQKIRILYPAWQNEKLVLFNVNASDMLPQRRWPQINFANVARELLSAFEDIVIIATGAPAEREYVQQVIDLADNKRFINSSGVFSFSELIPLYSSGTVMLTNDSGPAHFASVTPLKVFVLFGPETPALYLPLGNAEPIYLAMPCSPCVSANNHRKTTCLPRPCITQIQPSSVFLKLSSFLHQ